MYTMKMNQKYANDAMFFYYKVFDENLASLTQITEESKFNQKTLSPPPPLPPHTHTHTHTNTHTMKRHEY